MKRITGIPTRPNMVQQLLEVGFDYYNQPSSDGSHYWSDNVAYEFTLAEIDKIEKLLMNYTPCVWISLLMK